MDIQKIQDFWLEEAKDALQVAWHLFEKRDYSYSLFFGHLAIEKLLKAIYITRKKVHAPHIHNLKRLAELSDIELTEEKGNELIRITAFNLESRYPDEKMDFRKKCTEAFTNNELTLIEEVFKWLKSIL